MKRLVRNTIFFLLIFMSVANGQDFKRLYKNAKMLFDDGNYNLAMEAFKPLIVYDRNNPFTEYAGFYYAVSAYKIGYSAVARDMFLQIRKLQPDWEQLYEVNYWLAKSYFDQREYFQALLTLADLEGYAGQHFELANDVRLMKENYIAHITDAETLRMALEEYPTDVVIARAYSRALAKEVFNPEVLHEFDSLVNRFGFNRDDFHLELGPVSVRKEKYIVAVLFPFLSNAMNPSPTASRPNQAILDIYLGMRMAADSLAKTGVQLDLRAYDTERNIETLKRILRSDELKNADLIVGPIFPEELKYVQQFSIDNKINMISPVSNSPDFMRDNPFALLFQSSIQTIGVRAAEVMATAVRKRNCMVLYGDTQKDSVMAGSFMERAQSLGIQIVFAERYNRETANRIPTVLATATEFDEFKNPSQFSLRRDSIGGIFVASDNPLIYSKVNSSVTTRGDSIVVMGSEAWIAPENTSVSFENYERIHVLLAAPNFSSVRSVPYMNFRKNFMGKHGVYPTQYAKMGFEFTFFIGHALRDYGTYFQQGLSEKGYYKAWLYEGYDYANGSHDNQYVPFVYFNNGELTVFNKR